MLTIVNKIHRKEVYILSGNVKNYRTILTLFYILYSMSNSLLTRLSVLKLVAVSMSTLWNASMPCKTLLTSHTKIKNKRLAIG